MAQFFFRREALPVVHDLLHDHIGYMGTTEGEILVGYNFRNLTDAEFDLLIELAHDMGVKFNKNTTHNNFNHKVWLEDMVRALRSTCQDLIQRQITIYEENEHYWCYLPRIKRTMKDEILKAAKEHLKSLKPVTQ